MTLIRLRRNSSTEWQSLNPILLSGEPGYELDTGKFKLGDGSSKWAELDYFVPKGEILVMIQSAMDSGGVGGVSEAELDAHVNSLTPHPVYDDGPSLALLYENAKV